MLRVSNLCIVQSGIVRGAGYRVLTSVDKGHEGDVEVFGVGVEDQAMMSR